MSKQQEMQRYFDRAVSGILKQGSPGGSRMGAYYHSNGKKCAIGMLISEKEYDLKIEGACVGELIDLNFLPKKWKKHKEFLQELQKAHDTIMPTSDKEFIKQFKINVVELAAKYQISAEIIKKEK